MKSLPGLLIESPGKKIRILEVGIGDGILTRSIVPKLAHENVGTDATDLGRSFVLSAEKEARAAGLNFTKFGVLDISEDPEPTKVIKVIASNIILALDVVHATKNVRESIGHLKKLLAPRNSCSDRNSKTATVGGHDLGAGGRMVDF